MKVRELMTTDVATARLDNTLDNIARMMKEEDVGAIPVLDNGELCGIITDRDIVVRVVAEGLDPAEATVEDVLSPEIHTIEPEADVAKAARIMSEKQIRRLPVVENGELLGVVSIGDIAVKQGDERLSGEALEEVSKGVKREGGTRSGSESGKQRGSRAQNQRQGRMQVISNRNPRQEGGRQSRVPPKRAQAKSSRRRRAS